MTKEDRRELDRRFDVERRQDERRSYYALGRPLISIRPRCLIARNWHNADKTHSQTFRKPDDIRRFFQCLQ
ncbi:MAG: hypothetical protein HOM51_08805 [Rhodospirillaceae bacterium]|jgi:hypothetical protein|nr:hypothetical protein [Rhodospirillaceae bacterium]